MGSFYTKILEVNLFAFAYRLFHRDFSPINGTFCIGTHSFSSFICIFRSFRNEQYRNATTLSNYIWKLKDKNINYSLKWKIIDRGRAYQPSGKSCGLCDLEKFYLISSPELASLNQRNELATSCRHRKNHLLCNK